MQTSIQQVSPVEYEMVITATAEELAPEMDRSLRTQRAKMTLKGFRPGKVPLPYVKKLIGPAVAYEVAEQYVQQTYEREVVEPGTYQVLGRPMITDLEAPIDGEMRAVVRFGVRPEFELQDYTTEQVARLVHAVTDEDVERTLERQLEKAAEWVATDEPVDEASTVVVDVQALDEATGEPVAGRLDEAVELKLGDESLRADLKEALLGRRAGETFRYEMVHEGAHHHGDETDEEMLHEGEEAEHHHAHTHSHPYQVTVREVKRARLPALDDEFVQGFTTGRYQSVEDYRAGLRREIEQAWQKQSRDLLENDVIDRLVRMHPIPVPPSVVESFVDYYVEDFKRQYKNQMPAGFDEEYFRESNRDRAEYQARWMLIRDRIIEQEGIAVTDDDWERHFEEQAASMRGEISAEVLRGFYKQAPRLREQLDEQILTRKVFDVLATRFQMSDLDEEAYEQYLGEQAARRGDTDAEEETPADEEAR